MYAETPVCNVEYSRAINFFGKNNLKKILKVPIDIDPFISHPDPEKLCHITGVYAPFSLRKTLWLLFRPTRLRTAKEL